MITISDASAIVHRITDEVGRAVIGQAHLRDRLLAALIAEGHVLIEGVPGLAKTLSITALARAINASFQRIQFTPDLLPADVVGTEVFRPQDGRFEVRRGPVFANFVLADEINRAPAKVQSALLETMQERQVTIGTTTFPLPSPFFVMATQNPVEQEGTYRLPEAQVDRFLLKIHVDYPNPAEERQMLEVVSRAHDAAAQKSGGEEPRGNDALRLVSPVASLQDIVALRQLASTIYVDERIKSYIVSLVAATRTGPQSTSMGVGPLIELGASPRATIALFLVARAHALMSGEDYVSPHHVKLVAEDVLQHRIMPTFEAEARGVSPRDIVRMVLDRVEVP